MLIIDKTLGWILFSQDDEFSHFCIANNYIRSRSISNSLTIRRDTDLRGLTSLGIWIREERLLYTLISTLAVVLRMSKEKDMRQDKSVKKTEQELMKRPDVSLLDINHCSVFGIASFRWKHV